MSRKLLIRVWLWFGLALTLSAPALADPPLQPPVPVTIVGSVGVDGSGIIQKANNPQVLFNGRTPPHGFQIYAQQELWYTDFGTPTNLNNLSSPSWIAIQPGSYYTTPPGYRPPGPVYVYGGTDQEPFGARMW